MFRDTNLKVTFGFTIISIILQLLHCNLQQSKKRIFFDVLSLKVNLELNLYLIQKTAFKLTHGRMSRIVFSKVDLAESDNFSK